jgi:arsenite methyltransferase
MSGGTQLFDAETAGKVEAVYMTPDVVARRCATLKVLELAEGERILDIGSGPGLLAYDMAVAVGPQGRVCGIDTSVPMLAMASKRCAGQAWAEFEQADATELPIPTAASMPQSRRRSTSSFRTSRRHSPSFIGCCAPAGAR